MLYRVLLSQLRTRQRRSLHLQEPRPVPPGLYRGLRLLRPVATGLFRELRLLRHVRLEADRARLPHAQAASTTIEVTD